MAAAKKKEKTKKRPNVRVLGKYPATGIIFYLGQIFGASSAQIQGAFEKLGLKISEKTIRSYRGYWGGKPVPKVSQEDKAKLKASLPEEVKKERKAKPAPKKVAKPAVVKVAPKPIKVAPKLVKKAD